MLIVDTTRNSFTFLLERQAINQQSDNQAGSMDQDHGMAQRSSTNPNSSLRTRAKSNNFRPTEAPRFFGSFGTRATPCRDESLSRRGRLSLRPTVHQWKPS